LGAKDPRAQTAGGLLFPEGITHPVVNILRYIYYWNIQFQNNVIIIKTNVLFPQA
jgi:hypothetical protein